MDLPPEVLVEIISYIPTNNLYRCFRVCRKIYAVAMDEAGWQQRCRRDFGLILQSSPKWSETYRVYNQGFKLAWKVFNACDDSSDAWSSGWMQIGFDRNQARVSNGTISRDYTSESRTTKSGTGTYSICRDIKDQSRLGKVTISIPSLEIDWTVSNECTGGGNTSYASGCFVFDLVVAGEGGRVCLRPNRKESTL